jgi:hypothetical protein
MKCGCPIHPGKLTTIEFAVFRMSFHSLELLVLAWWWWFACFCPMLHHAARKTLLPCKIQIACLVCHFWDVSMFLTLTCLSHHERTLIECFNKLPLMHEEACSSCQARKESSGVELQVWQSWSSGGSKQTSTHHVHQASHVLFPCLLSKTNQESHDPAHYTYLVATNLRFEPWAYKMQHQFELSSQPAGASKKAWLCLEHKKFPCHQSDDVIGQMMMSLIKTEHKENF